MSDRYYRYPATANSVGVLDTFGVRPNLGLVSNLGRVENLGLFGAFTPASLFGPTDVGLWYDYSDTASLRQDSAGTTAITTLGQPVGLVFDKSRGALSNLGPEQVVNGDFSSATGWTLDAGVSISGGSMTFASVSSTLGAFQGYTSIPENAICRIVIAVTAYTSGQFRVRVNAGTYVLIPATVGTHTVFVIAGPSTTVGIQVAAAGTTSGVVDSISLQRVPGNHAIQSTPTARPVWDARKNLLTFSEQFGTSPWTATNATVTPNTEVAPDGTTTADTLTTNGSALVQFVTQSNAQIGQVTFSVYVKAGTAQFVQILNSATGDAFGNFDISTGALGTKAAASTTTITDAGNGWWRCSVSVTLATSAAWRIYVVSSASAAFGATFSATVATVYLWGAQLELGSTATSYQRVTTATDYADVGFSRGALFDGSDDFLVTAANLVMTSTDAVTIVAGVEKRTDAAGMITELSTTTANNGSFNLYATSPAGWGGNSTGTGQAFNSVTTGYPPPASVVLSSQADISSDFLVNRLNGVQLASSTQDQGTGNFGSYLLYLGRRAGTTLPLNGRITQLIIIGRLLSAAELAQVERYVANQSGVLIP